MSDGYTTVQSWIARLRELGQSAEDIAADVAPELRKELEKNISEGRDPAGQPWKMTKQGKQPLVNAAKALNVAAVDTKVLAVVHGIEARHHSGHVRGGIARPIIPGADLPKEITDLVTRIAQKRFRLIMGGV
jgi:hypothetical protein